MRSIRSRASTASLLVLLGCGLNQGCFAASVIYGATQDGIYSIDVDSRQVQQIASIPGAYAIAAGFSPGELYVRTSLGLGTDTYRFQVGVGLGENVGPTHGVGLGDGPDGRLYSGTGTLYWLDPSNTFNNPVGPLLTLLAGDIATSPSGITYGAAATGIMTIDRATAAQSAILVASPSTWLFGLAFTRDGRMWASVSDSINSQIYQVDLASGSMTPMLTLTGLDILDLASEPVPAPPTALGMLLVLSGCRRRRYLQ